MTDNDSKKKIVELEAEIRRLKKFNLGLVFEDKSEKVVKQCKEQVPVLKESKTRRLELDEAHPNNLIIEGDNYHALSVLNYTHKGKIDVIYIDPPYNTGNRDFIYNDQYVDAEDSYRHSKWLSFMNSRLILARDLLKPAGLIFISIDDNEQAHLRILCDKIFGERNFVATLPTVMNLKGNQDQFGFAGTHEYTLVYAKDKSFAKLNQFDVDEEKLMNEWKQDKYGFYKKGANLKATGINAPRGKRPNLFYPIFLNDTDGIYTTENNEPQNQEDTIILPKTDGEEMSWRWSKSKLNGEKHNVILSKDGGISLYKKQRPQLGDIPTKKPKTLFYKPEYSSGNGTTQLKELFGHKNFDNPKPLDLIKDIIHLATDKNAVVLDFMAGSGTTGQATLKLNAEDGGSRRFILCTNNEDNNGNGIKIATDVCYPRIEKAIKGYGIVEGLPGNLFYYQTDLVNIEQIHKVPDEAKIRITHQAGEMIAVRENSLKETEKNRWWQIFEGKGKLTAIYFKEDKTKLAELVDKLEKRNLPVALYIFGWSSNEYKDEYWSENIRIEDIPEPIIKVYRELNCP